MPLRRRLVAAALLLLLAACGGGGPVETGDTLPPGELAEETGLAHAHGLGINPADGALYVATHFGLWRLPDGAEAAERVGDLRHDLMGFTVAGADHFVASGHPILHEDLPPRLGLIESRDGGQTWRSVSLLGEVDFHVLRQAHGNLYGWDSGSGRLLVSADGETWDERTVDRALIDFAVDPADAEHLVGTKAAGETTQVVRSDDGGRSWEPVSAGDAGASGGDAAPTLVRLAWDDALWAGDAEGAVWRSADAGASWERAGEVGFAVEALLADGDTVFAAAGGTVRRSDDAGRTWVTVHEDPPHQG